MMSDVRGYSGVFGCGGCMGQLDPSAIAAAGTSAEGTASASPFPFVTLFLVSVAAGCTVWIITRALGGEHH